MSLTPQHNQALPESSHRRIHILSQQLHPQDSIGETQPNIHLTQSVLQTSIQRNYCCSNCQNCTTCTKSNCSNCTDCSKSQNTSNRSNCCRKMSSLRVLVTGAAGQIAYSLLPKIAQGEMFGPNQSVILHLLEVPQAEEAQKGVVMELEDSAYPLLESVIATSDNAVAFKDIDVAIFVGAFPRKDGMERKDLLQKNAGIFKSQASFLDRYAKKNVKVLVVGNPANTNCLILQENAKSIPKENFSALTRLDHNRAKAQLALRLGVNVSQIHNSIIWGNHSSTQYPDVNHAFVERNGNKVSIREAIANDTYLNGEFISTVQKRGAEIIKARKLSSATSAAKAICDHIREWIYGTPGEEIISMAVPSDGSYGVKEGLIFSYPVRCREGKYQIIQGLKIDEFSQKLLNLTEAELREERKLALEE